MSTYKEIRGLKVRDYTTNPDNPIEGQLWYNTTDNVAKYQIPNQVAAWRSQVNLNLARYGGGGAGTNTSGLVFAGYTSPPADSGRRTETEEWNGSAWTEVADLNTGRAAQLGGVGVSAEAALCFGGEAPPGDSVLNETWNGSAWTEVGDLNNARRQMSS